MSSRTDLHDATVGQVMIPVTDLDRAVEFYRDVLGARFLFTAPPQMSFFQLGPTRLLVGVPEGDASAGRGSIVYFQVADIEAVHRTLADRGVRFAAPPRMIHRDARMELWLAEFRDPDGNALALMMEHALGA